MPKNNHDVSSSTPISIEAFLTQKNLPLDLFDQPDMPTLASPIKAHSAFVYKYLLSHLYNGETETVTDIARPVHGIQHANRVAFFIMVWANFLRRHQSVFENTANYKKHINDFMSRNNRKAYQAFASLIDDIHPEDLMFCQIGGLFHDAGREGDDKDTWEKDSAVLCYLYLIKLGFSQEKACYFAGVIANKDNISSTAEVLNITDNNEIFWQKADFECDVSNHLLLHDADCLDIIRARPHFKASKTHFGFVLDSFTPNPDELKALNEMAAIISEVRSLLDKQGDSFHFNDFTKKSYYENENGYDRHLELIQHHFPVLAKLYNHGELLSKEEAQQLTLIDEVAYDPTKGLTEYNLTRAMQEGKLFSRSLVIPSAQSRKPITYANGSIERETLAQLELRKLARRKNKKTSSSKNNNNNKTGNRYRSISMLSHNSATFSDCGYWIIDPPIDDIIAVSAVDADTGFQKKEGVEFIELSAKKKKKELTHLLTTLKTGGESRYYGDFPSRHNEIICHLEKYDTVYFTNDPTARNQLDLNDARPVHPHAPILKAIYLQNEYKKKFGKKLPIFEYSGTHNHIRKVKKAEYSEERILSMWKEMLTDCVKRLSMSHEGLLLLAKQDIEALKVNAIYGLNELKHTADFSDKLQAVDINYATPLKKAIDEIAKEACDHALNLITTFELLLQAAIEDDLEAFHHLNLILPLQNLADNEKYLLMADTFKNNSEKILAYVVAQDDDQSFVNATNISNDSLLIEAINNNDIDRVNYLIKHGADINKETNGTNPVIVAIANNHKEIVAALLAAGVDVNNENCHGVTPLYLAVNFGNKKLLKLLLTAGADPNCYSEKLLPPVMLAASQPTILQKLIDQGANVNIQHLTPMETIFHVKKIYCLEDKEMLQEYCQDDKVILTPIQYAMFLQESKSVLSLMKAGGGFMLNAAQKKSLSSDCMPGDKTLGQKITSSYINSFAIEYLKGIEYFVDHFTDNDSIDEIVANEELLSLITKYNTDLLVKIAKLYFDQHHQALTCQNVPSLLNVCHSRVIAALNQGILSFQSKDQYGRVKFSEDDVSKKLTVRNITPDYKIGQDYSHVNYDNVHFENCNLSNSHWRIMKTDKITFKNCQMDNFTLTSESELNRVRICGKPIFSSREAAGKVAAYFPTIPIFILQTDYMDEVRKLLEKGKVLQFSKVLLNHIYKLIEHKQMTIATFIINYFKGQNSHLDELKEPIALIKKYSNLKNHINHLEEAIEHTGVGKRGRYKKNSLVGQLTLFKQTRQNWPTIVEEQQNLKINKP